MDIKERNALENIANKFREEFSKIKIDQIPNDVSRSINDQRKTIGYELSLSIMRHKND